MRFGVLMLPVDDWAITVSRARRLEEMGYDHLWTYDHLTWRRYRDHAWHAAVPWLTGIASATSHIRLGTMVASPNFRHPLTLAKDAVTLDHVSNGRLVLGVGAGGLGYDATVFGAEPLSRRELIDRLEEFVSVLDGVFRDPNVSFTGSYYTVTDAQVLPRAIQRPRIPIAIAAGGRRALSLVAQYGDGWITYETEDIVRAQYEQLAKACESAGRSLAGIDRIYLIGNTEARPLRSTAAFEDFTGRCHALGFTDIVFHHPLADDPVWNEPVEIVERIAADVLPGWRSF